MKWQVDRVGFFEDERKSIRRAFPDVELLEIKGLVVLRGSFPVYGDSGSEIDRYRLEISFPHNYPDKVPEVHATDKRIPASVERHIFPKTRNACLCLPHEIPLLLPNVTFMLFWEKLLRYWLVGQAYFDRHGKWPFEARSHDVTAIYDGLSELLEISERDAVQKFTILLLRRYPAKGHELCPCGSRQRLRNCHQQAYCRVRALLSSEVIELYRNLLF